MDLLCLKILLNTPGAEFAPEPGLFVPTPRSLHVSGLHMIYPHDSGPERFDHAKSFEDVPRPHCRGQPIRRVISDPDRFCLIAKRNDCRDRAKDLFTGDTGTVVDVAENCWLDVAAALEAGWAASSYNQPGYAFPNPDTFGRSYCSLLTTGPILFSRSIGV